MANLAISIANLLIINCSFVNKEVGMKYKVVIVVLFACGALSSLGMHNNAIFKFFCCVCPPNNENENDDPFVEIQMVEIPKSKLTPIKHAEQREKMRKQTQENLQLFFVQKRLDGLRKKFRQQFKNAQKQYNIKFKQYEKASEQRNIACEAYEQRKISHEKYTKAEKQYEVANQQCKDAEQHYKTAGQKSTDAYKVDKTKNPLKIREFLANNQESTVLE